MKKLISAILCFVFVFACMQLPVSASPADTDVNATARLSYINDAQVSIGKSGSYIRTTGVLSCNSLLTSSCTITLSVYSRDKGSSDSWTREKTVFANGTYYCSTYCDIPLDSTKEYRGKIYCAAHPSGDGGIENISFYTSTYTPS